MNSFLQMSLPTWNSSRVYPGIELLVVCVSSDLETAWHSSYYNFHSHSSEFPLFYMQTYASARKTCHLEKCEKNFPCFLLRTCLCVGWWSISEARVNHIEQPIQRLSNIYSSLGVLALWLSSAPTSVLPRQQKKARQGSKKPTCFPGQNGQELVADTVIVTWSRVA